MRIFVRVMLALGILLSFSLEPVAAETMYAKKDRVKVTIKKTPRSKVVTTLGLGEKVEIIKKEKRQYQVKLKNGETGWVFKFKLSASKPRARNRGKSGLSGLTGKSVVVAKESRAGGSIRGLKESTEKYVKDKHINPAHQTSVDKMEQFQVTEQELLVFQEQGGVGAYAGGGQ